MRSLYVRCGEAVMRQIVRVGVVLRGCGRVLGGGELGAGSILCHVESVHFARLQTLLI